MSSIDFDPEDYIDEVSSYILIDELKRRNILPKSFSNDLEEKFSDRFPMREALTNILNISPLSTLDDIIQAVKENYNK